MKNVETDLEVRISDLVKIAKENDSKLLFFQQMFYRMPLAMAIYDENRRFISANNFFCEAVGLSEEELKGLRIEDITHPDDVETSVVLFDAMVQKHIPYLDMSKRVLNHSTNKYKKIKVRAWIQDDKVIGTFTSGE